MSRSNKNKYASNRKTKPTDEDLQKFTQWSLDVGESTARTFIQTLADVLPNARHRTNMAEAVLDADDPQLMAALKNTAELETLLGLNEDLLATIEQERADLAGVIPRFEKGRLRGYNSDCATRILRILNDSAAKMKETAPNLRPKLFKNFKELQREYSLLSISF
jgi:hypothetical protein